MRQRDRLERLEQGAPAYSEVWRPDGAEPGLYRCKEQALTSAELDERERGTPGLTVIRIHRRIYERDMS